MTRPVKFLFDTEFVAEARKAAEPKVTLAEHQQLLALARQEGYASGFVDGEGEAQRSIQRQQAIAFDAVGQRLAAAAAALDALEGRLEQEAIDIAVAVAGKLAAGLIARQPLEEIRRLVGECFANLRGVPHLVIRVHDDLLERAREELTRLAAERGFEGRLVILAEPVIAPGDCRIEWSTGGIMLDRDEITARIAEAVDRYLASHSSASERTS
ncbi:FliH/SctL family protein [Phreatobacter sp.]|uniref:FliH/SctL family protein n=1 Tax=Phreatobacter sp. TaxID=1966341 RepID=UPI003F6EC17E